MSQEESRLKLKQDWKKLTSVEITQRLRHHFRTYTLPTLRSNDDKKLADPLRIFDGNLV